MAQPALKTPDLSAPSHTPLGMVARYEVMASSCQGHLGQGGPWLQAADKEKGAWGVGEGVQKWDSQVLGIPHAGYVLTVLAVSWAWVVGGKGLENNRFTNSTPGVCVSMTVLESSCLLLTFEL